MTRENCEFKERCGATGHYLEKGLWVRCVCLQMELNKKKLGVFDTEKPVMDSPLLKLVHRDVLIEGPLRTVREHVSGVLLKLDAGGRSYGAMDAYRLIEIFLDKDEEFNTTQDLADYDLFILLLGFGDIANRRLPDIIMQVFNRRELVRKPTWCVLGLPIGQVATKYDSAVAERISSFKRARVDR